MLGRKAKVPEARVEARIYKKQVLMRWKQVDISVESIPLGHLMSA